MGFDFTRWDWYPWTLGGPGQVSMSDGRPRPALATPLSTFGVHYAGAGSSWLDSGDTVQELLSVEMNHARPSRKPNEYNSVSDIDSATYEYAGPYRAAHSSGNNDTAWGHLCLYGLEVLTEKRAQALIAGIRRARRQCVEAGYLTPDHAVLAHGQLPGAATSCPGPLFTDDRWWAQITAPLATFTPPAPTAEDIDDMAALDKPIRWFDTRKGWGPLQGGTVFDVALPAALAGAKDLQINATVTEPDGAGYLTVWPDGSQPVVSNLNYATGQTVANGTLVKVGADAKVRFWLTTTAHLVVDIQGARE